MAPLPDDAVGLGYRPALAGDLLRSPSTVDFVEVVAEACLHSPGALREVRALGEIWPVIPHGVKLSLGSADGVDDDKARRLGELARALNAPFVSEHAAFTQAAGVEIGHLTQLPRTRAAVRALARNVDRVRRHFGMPLLLENVAWTWRWPDDEMGEGDFYAEVVAATGCDLLLDLANLRANALNEGKDPHAVLASYPLSRVAMVHIAGGVTVDGFFFDNHAAAVPDDVFALLASLVQQTGPRPVLLERDGAFPPFSELQAELERARSMLQQAASPPPAVLTTHAPRSTKPTAPSAEHALGALAAAQATLARRLAATDLADVVGDLAVDERVALERARMVLSRKRVDDALPLLFHLSRRGVDVEHLAARALAGTARPSRGVAPRDATRIARAALHDERFVDDARRDLLHLRARFVGVDDGEGGALRARRAPFVGGERLEGGHRCVVVKGPGAGAALRHIERRAETRATAR